jgi:hypothetical protein
MRFNSTSAAIAVLVVLTLPNELGLERREWMWIVRSVTDRGDLWAAVVPRRSDGSTLLDVASFHRATRARF